MLKRSAFCKRLYFALRTILLLSTAHCPAVTLIISLWQATNECVSLAPRVRGCSEGRAGPVGPGGNTVDFSGVLVLLAVDVSCGVQCAACGTQVMSEAVWLTSSGTGKGFSCTWDLWHEVGCGESREGSG